MDDQPENAPLKGGASASPDGSDSHEQPPEKQEPLRKRFSLKSRRGLLLIAVTAAMAAAAVFYFHYTSRFETTDDAQVDGHIDPVSARVNGHIKAVYVSDGQSVKAGALLVTIDPSDYRTAYAHAKAVFDKAVDDAQAARLNVQVTRTRAADRIAEAQAGLEVARSIIDTSRQAYRVARAERRTAQARELLAEKNLQRAEKLIAQNAISRQSYDQTQAAAQSAEDSLTAARDKVTAAAKKQSQARAQLDQAQAVLQDAQNGPEQVGIAVAKSKSSAAVVEEDRAAMEQARLNLQYTRITAPAGGIIGNKNVEIGQNVSPGQLLLDLVQTGDVWVTANFKENQLHHMRPGQRVDIHVDAFDKNYKGRVKSIGAATGERFSLFPPENATGNYVKVVQRIPVKIVFDKGENARHRLRPGMSVEPKVWIK